jgi:hypothetical protein
MRVAHASSTCGVAFAAGRQLKIRRRLGVSPLPPGLYGPVTVNVNMCGIPSGSRGS